MKPPATQPQPMEASDSAVEGVPHTVQLVDVPISQGSTAPSDKSADALARRHGAAIRAAEDGLRIASQQEDEAVRSLKSAEMELQEAKSAEAERVQRVKAPAPKKGGILRNMLKKKKQPTADWPAAGEIPVSLSSFEAKVDRLRKLVAATADAKMAADEVVQHARRDMSRALEMAAASSVQSQEVEVHTQPNVIRSSNATTDAMEAPRQDEPHSQPAAAASESRLEAQAAVPLPGGDALLMDDHLAEGGSEDYEQDVEEGEEESDEDADSDFCGGLYAKLSTGTTS